MRSGASLSASGVRERAILESARPGTRRGRSFAGAGDGGGPQPCAIAFCAYFGPARYADHRRTDVARTLAFARTSCISIGAADADLGSVFFGGRVLWLELRQTGEEDCEVRTHFFPKIRIRICNGELLHEKGQCLVPVPSWHAGIHFPGEAPVIHC